MMKCFFLLFLSLVVYHAQDRQWSVNYADAAPVSPPSSGAGFFLRLFQRENDDSPDTKNCSRFCHSLLRPSTSSAKSLNFLLLKTSKEEGKLNCDATHTFPMKFHGSKWGSVWINDGIHGSYDEYSPLACLYQLPTAEIRSFSQLYRDKNVSFLHNFERNPRRCAGTDMILSQAVSTHKNMMCFSFSRLPKGSLPLGLGGGVCAFPTARRQLARDSRLFGEENPCGSSSNEASVDEGKAVRKRVENLMESMDLCRSPEATKLLKAINEKVSILQAMDTTFNANELTRANKGIAHKTKVFFQLGHAAASNGIDTYEFVKTLAKHYKKGDLPPQFFVGGVVSCFTQWILRNCGEDESSSTQVAAEIIAGMLVFHPDYQMRMGLIKGLNYWLSETPEECSSSADSSISLPTKDLAQPTICGSNVCAIQQHEEKNENQFQRGHDDFPDYPLLQDSESSCQSLFNGTPSVSSEAGQTLKNNNLEKFSKASSSECVSFTKLEIINKIYQLRRFCPKILRDRKLLEGLSDERLVGVFCNAMESAGLGNTENFVLIGQKLGESSKSSSSKGDEVLLQWYSPKLQSPNLSRKSDEVNQFPGNSSLQKKPPSEGEKAVSEIPAFSGSKTHKNQQIEAGKESEDFVVGHIIEPKMFPEEEETTGSSSSSSSQMHLHEEETVDSSSSSSFQSDFPAKNLLKTSKFLQKPYNSHISSDEDDAELSTGLKPPRSKPIDALQGGSLPIFLGGNAMLSLPSRVGLSANGVFESFDDVGQYTQEFARAMLHALSWKELEAASSLGRSILKLLNLVMRRHLQFSSTADEDGMKMQHTQGSAVSKSSSIEKQPSSLECSAKSCTWRAVSPSDPHNPYLTITGPTRIEKKGSKHVHDLETKIASESSSSLPVELYYSYFFPLTFSLEILEEKGGVSAKKAKNEIAADESQEKLLSGCNDSLVDERFNDKSLHETDEDYYALLKKLGLDLKGSYRELLTRLPESPGEADFLSSQTPYISPTESSGFSTSKDEEEEEEDVISSAAAFSSVNASHKAASKRGAGYTEPYVETTARSAGSHTQASSSEDAFHHSTSDFHSASHMIAKQIGEWRSAGCYPFFDISRLLSIGQRRRVAGFIIDSRLFPGESKIPSGGGMVNEEGFEASSQNTKESRGTRHKNREKDGFSGVEGTNTAESKEKDGFSQVKAIDSAASMHLMQVPASVNEAKKEVAQDLTGGFDSNPLFSSVKLDDLITAFYQDAKMRLFSGTFLRHVANYLKDEEVSKLLQLFREIFPNLHTHIKRKIFLKKKDAASSFSSSSGCIGDSASLIRYLGLYSRPESQFKEQWEELQEFILEGRKIADIEAEDDEVTDDLSEMMLSNPFELGTPDEESAEAVSRLDMDREDSSKNEEEEEEEEKANSDFLTKNESDSSGSRGLELSDLVNLDKATLIDVLPSLSTLIPEYTPLSNLQRYDTHELKDLLMLAFSRLEEIPFKPQFLQRFPKRQKPGNQEDFTAHQTTPSSSSSREMMISFILSESEIDAELLPTPMRLSKAALEALSDAQLLNLFRLIRDRAKSSVKDDKRRLNRSDASSRSGKIDMKFSSEYVEENAASSEEARKNEKISISRVEDEEGDDDSFDDFCSGCTITDFENFEGVSQLSEFAGEDVLEEDNGDFRKDEVDSIKKSSIVGNSFVDTAPEAESLDFTAVKDDFSSSINNSTTSHTEDSSSQPDWGDFSPLSLNGKNDASSTLKNSQNFSSKHLSLGIESPLSNRSINAHHSNSGSNISGKKPSVKAEENLQSRNDDFPKKFEKSKKTPFSGTASSHKHFTHNWLPPSRCFGDFDVDSTYPRTILSATLASRQMDEEPRISPSIFETGSSSNSLPRDPNRESDAAASLQRSSSASLSFTSLGLNRVLSEAVAKNLGVKAKPSKIQLAAIPELIARKNVAFASETGSGKTLAYLLPVFEALKMEEKNGIFERKLQRPRVLIVSPTRELSKQILEVVKSFSHHIKIASTGLIGGESWVKQKRRLLLLHTDVIVATATRLLLHLRDENLSLEDISHFIIDEIDNVLLQGFKEEIEEIITRIKQAGKDFTSDRKDRKVQFIASSSTLGNQVKSLLKSETFPEMKIIELSLVHRGLPSLKHEMIDLKGEDKLTVLKRVLTKVWAENEKIVIFCNSISSCRACEFSVRESGFASKGYHGDIPQKLRTENLESFRNGSVRVLVSTDLASRGLHIPGITTVIMFDFCKNPIDYIHRSGRTARLGTSGRVISLLAKGDLVLGTAIMRSVKLNLPIDKLSSDKNDYTKGGKLDYLSQAGGYKVRRPNQTREPLNFQSRRQFNKGTQQKSYTVAKRVPSKLGNRKLTRGRSSFSNRKVSRAKTAKNISRSRTNTSRYKSIIKHDRKSLIKRRRS